MKNWFLLLLSYFYPAIGGEPDDEVPPDDDETPPPEDDDETPPPEDDDETPPPEDDEPEEAPAPRESRVQRQMRETRDRAQTAERDLATARAELDTARRGPAPTPQPNQEQVLWQQEEDTLRNPEATDWQRYAIQANRTSRQASADSKTALQRAEDLSDKSAFAALAATKPKMYAAYKDKVEAKLAELRKGGYNPSREGILKALLGEDMLSGNFKSAEAKLKTSGAAQRVAPRSDVAAPRGNAGLSESEKRTRRLENVRI